MTETRIKNVFSKKEKNKKKYNSREMTRQKLITSRLNINNNYNL